MLHEDTVKNRYSCDEPQNLSCAREYRAFQLLQLLCSSRLFEADPSPGLWPSPFFKGELADRYSQRVSPSRPVISSGVSMLHEDTVKNRYSFEEPRNLSCGRECRAFQLLQLLRSSRLFEADPSPGLWPSPFFKGELADRYSQRVSPSRPVISSGVSMLHEDTVKNRYSFEEPRNLSCGREYGAFQLLQPFRGKCPPQSPAALPSVSIS